MTIHYPVESLRGLFLSEKYILDKNNYKPINLSEVKEFLNSIEINKQYYRTGILVKNPKYKKKVSQDTIIIKEFKTSLNKLSSINYKKLCSSIVGQVKSKDHLYPLIIETIFEQALLHHSYSKYYCHLVNLLHLNYNMSELIYKQIDLNYKTIQDSSSNNLSEYSQLCNKNKKTDQLIGYCMFLFELETSNIIENKLEPMISTLINNIKETTSEDEVYKCVTCLYTLCKQMYKDNPIPEKYLSDIELLKQTKYMKVKFKLMDIIERR
jgi:hypothetical protein